MMKCSTLKVENKNTLGSVQKTLAQLMESGFIDALLVPRRLPGGGGFAQCLIKDPGLISEAYPMAPTMPVQSATILTQIASEPGAGRIGAVMKPCELRAATELVKFLQTNLENVVTIGIDCGGTRDVRTYAESVNNGNKPPSDFVFDWEDSEVRTCCQICENPVPLNSDLAFGFFGYNPGEEILLSVGERFERELSEVLAVDGEAADTAKRDATIEKVIAKRKTERERVYGELKQRTDGLEQLMQVLTTCIRCHNCMKACPICYCKQCVFESSIFEHYPDQFLTWAERKGAVRLPSDTLIFHLTRMSHMATSCVGCGLCESACPSQLPVSSLFGLVGAEVQALFDYFPGRDAAEKPPVAVFKEEELQAETEAPR